MATDKRRRNMKNSRIDRNRRLELRPIEILILAGLNCIFFNHFFQSTFTQGHCLFSFLPLTKSTTYYIAADFIVNKNNPFTVVNCSKLNFQLIQKLINHKTFSDVGFTCIKQRRWRIKQSHITEY